MKKWYTAFLSCHQSQIKKILNYTNGFFEKHSEVFKVMSWESHEAHSGSWFHHLLDI